jgi:hypothetical protein
MVSSLSLLEEKRYGGSELSRSYFCHVLKSCVSLQMNYGTALTALTRIG